MSQIPAALRLPENIADTITVTKSATVLPAGSRGEGVRAHCLRVATWSSELAAALGLPENQRKLVEQAALSHHVPEFLLDDRARNRLLEEMELQETGAQSLVPEEVRQVLQAYRGRHALSDAGLAQVVAVLEISDDFDQFFESEPLFDSDMPDQCAAASVETMMSYLQVTNRSDVNRVIDRLPVFPRAAREVIRCASNPEVTVHQLESVASQDPVLAGRLIQTANSAYYSPRLPIGSIPHAVAYIGADTTRRILLAAALRGNFGSMRLHQLWNHSLDVAHAAELLAGKSERNIDSSEAFLAGLVHDIGRLAFSILPSKFLERYNRLTDGGCPCVEVEQGLSGRSHADVGAETLAQWKFPDAIVQAVRWHHRPERSLLPLASLLYLAEHVCDSEEDIPSYVRLAAACGQCGIDPSALAWIARDGDYLQSLRFAA